MLGEHKAHPTRILARWASVHMVQAADDTLKPLGLRIEKRYRLVPALTLLDESGGPALAGGTAFDESASRQRLLERIEALKATGQFEYVEPDYIVQAYATPSDGAFVGGSLWGLQNLGQMGGTVGADISATTAWDITTGSTNVVVAVIDSGIRYTHQDLTNQVWINPGEIPGNNLDDDGNGFIDDVHGINAILGSGDPYDDHNHGTHCAGTIGAAANDGHPHVGVCWHVQIMGCKFLSSYGGGTTGDAITCIDYAVLMGAKILNNSWGGGPFSSALFDSIRNAGDQGVLFVAAAGNSANDNDARASYPASYQLPNIISVAAVDRFDNLADFSNYGATSVHLGAPGVEIYSTIANFDAGYDLFDGTSMAAPHVTGVAALILGHFGAPLDEIKDRLLSGVVPTSALQFTTSTGGRLNAYNSLTIQGSGALKIRVDPPSGSTILSGSQQPMYVRVTDRFGITTATVVATTDTGTRLTFRNDGLVPDTTSGDATYSANLAVPTAGETISMVLTVSAPGKVAVTNVVNYTIIPPPPNDFFNSPLKVSSTGSRYLSNNRFATLQPGEPQHGGVATSAASLWWAWTAPGDTNVLVDASGSDIAAVLAVYTGSALTSLKPIASTNSPAGTRGTHLFFNAKNAQTYMLAVAGVNTNSRGTLRLRVAPGGQIQTQPPQVAFTSPVSGYIFTNATQAVQGIAADVGAQAFGIAEVLVSVNGGISSPANGTTNWASQVLLQPGANQVEVRAVNIAGITSAPQKITLYYRVPGPANDNFNESTLLAGTSGTSSGNTQLATKQPSEPRHAGNDGGHSLWWKWVAPADGSLLLSTDGSTLDTVLAVYLGSRVDSLRMASANDDAYDGVKWSKVQQGVRANQTYHLAVDGFNGSTGLVELAYAFTPGDLFRIDLQTTAGGSVAEHDSGLVDVPANSFQTLTAVADAGYRFAGWQGAAVSTANPLSLQVDSNITLRATFSPLLYTDDFETGDFSRLPWATSGGQPWKVTQTSAAGGKYAAQSGAIGHNQSSSLSLTGNFLAGSVTFSQRVSCETGWDYAEFLLDGVQLLKRSGEIDWTQYSFPITAGTHTLRWNYVKDADVSSGSDAVFIDNLVAPRVPPVDSGSAATLNVVLLPQGQYELRIAGQTNQVYVTQTASQILPDGKTVWAPYSTNVAEYGVIRLILDAQALSKPQSYFRAVAR